MKRSADISRIIAPLKDTPFQSYISNALQVADILEHALEYTGPADIVMTSFSISEEFLRRLFFIRKKDKIKSLRVILDYKATNKTLILWPFIAQTIEHCYLADNHSKILLIKGENNVVSVVMSQNLTRGNRYECASICTDAICFDRLSGQVNKIIETQSVPFNDVFARTVAEN